MPSSSSGMPTIFLPWRAASSAASLTRLARSAPVKPGVCAASASRSIVLGDRLAARVHLEDLPAAGAVRPVDDDLTVEAARPQQRRVEDVGPVGGGDEDDVVLHLEAVHLDEQLVERLLALVVAAAHAGAAVTADGVDLVDEDDAGRVLLGLLEQVAHARGADADEHLDEVRARDAEERHAGLAGDGAREQRLAGAGRAVEQHALGDAGAELLELLRVLEELLDLLELLDRLVDAGHVLERDLGRVDADAPGAALAEAHHLGAAALHLVHDEDPEADDEDEAAGRWRGRCVHHELPGLLELNATAACSTCRQLGELVDAGSDRELVLVVGRFVGGLDLSGLVVGFERDRLDLAGLQIAGEAPLGPGVDVLVLAAVAALQEPLLDDDRQDDDDEDGEERTADEFVQVCLASGAGNAARARPGQRSHGSIPRPGAKKPARRSGRRR